MTHVHINNVSMAELEAALRCFSGAACVTVNMSGKATAAAVPSAGWRPSLNAHTAATAWIGSNPPADGESEEAHFGRYKATLGRDRDIDTCSFATIARALLGTTPPTQLRGGGARAPASVEQGAADGSAVAPPEPGVGPGKAETATPAVVPAVAYVYFITTSNHYLDQVVKVGCCADPAAYMATLQDGNMYKLIMHTVIAIVDRYEIERWLHQRLAMHCLDCGWYRLSLTDLNTVVRELNGRVGPAPQQ